MYQPLRQRGFAAYAKQKKKINWLSTPCLFLSISRFLIIIHALYQSVVKQLSVCWSVKISKLKQNKKKES